MHCCVVLLCEVYYVIVLGLGIIVVFICDVTPDLLVIIIIIIIIIINIHIAPILFLCYSPGISCTSRELTVCGSIEKEKGQFVIVSLSLPKNIPLQSFIS